MIADKTLFSSGIIKKKKKKKIMNVKHWVLTLLDSGTINQSASPSPSVKMEKDV